MSWISDHLQALFSRGNRQSGVGFPRAHVNELSETLRSAALFEERGQAALRLGASVDVHSVTQLSATATLDPDLSVRRVALWSLASLAEEHSVGAAARRQIRRSLREIGAEVCVRRAQRFGDEYAAAFCDLSERLGRSARPAVGALRTLALSESAEIRERAVRALEHIQPGTAHAYFLKAFQRDYAIRPSVSVLGLFASERLRASMVKELESWVDAPSAYSGGFHDRTSQRAIHRAEKALCLLAELRPIDSGPVLFKAMSHCHYLVSRCAVERVAEMVTDARLPVTALIAHVEAQRAVGRDRVEYIVGLEALAKTARPEAFRCCIEGLIDPPRGAGSSTLMLALSKFVVGQRYLLTAKDREALVERCIRSEGVEGEVIRDTLAKTVTDPSPPEFVAALSLRLQALEIESGYFDNLVHLLSAFPPRLSLSVVEAALPLGMTPALDGQHPMPRNSLDERILRLDALRRQYLVQSIWESNSDSRLS